MTQQFDPQDIPPSKWEQFKNDITVVDQQLKEKSCKWKVGSFLLLIGLPFFLVIFQIFVRAAIIPPEYTVSHLLLNFSQPDVTAMFATNYIHDVWLPEHVIGNTTGYFVILYFTFILYFIIIPILKIHNILHFEYSDSAFFGTAVAYLLGLPFAVSGVSILFGRMLSQTGDWGFSGVVWAFEAYLFFLLLIILYDYILHRIPSKDENNRNDITGSQVVGPETNSVEKPTKTSIALSLIFINLIIIILPIYAILSEMGNKKIAIFGHFAGFTVGLFIAALVMMICERKRKKSQIALFIMLLMIITLPSISWLFFGS